MRDCQRHDDDGDGGGGVDDDDHHGEKCDACDDGDDELLLHSAQFLAGGPGPTRVRDVLLEKFASQRFQHFSSDSSFINTLLLFKLLFLFRIVIMSMSVLAGTPSQVIKLSTNQRHSSSKSCFCLSLSRNDSTSRHGARRYSG